MPSDNDSFFFNIRKSVVTRVLYINPDDEKEFADAIITLSKNNQLRNELIIKGKRQVERYSWRKSAAIFL